MRLWCENVNMWDCEVLIMWICENVISRVRCWHKDRLVGWEMVRLWYEIMMWECEYVRLWYQGWCVGTKTDRLDEKWWDYDVRLCNCDVRLWCEIVMWNCDVRLWCEIVNMWDCDVRMWICEIVISRVRCWHEDRLVGWEMVRLPLLIRCHSLDCRLALTLNHPIALHCHISLTLSHPHPRIPIFRPKYTTCW